VKKILVGVVMGIVLSAGALLVFAWWLTMPFH